LGIIGTGLLAIPVLAGSAAYAVAEVFGWPSTLEAKFPEAIGFYAIILAATIIGLAMGFLPINPIQLLVWTAVGCNCFDGRHGRRINLVATALGSTMSLTILCQPRT
jgi:Mn2+/Fe2+ NRAMP family transporter